MVKDAFDFADELGPARVIHVWEPRSGLRGILVIDNVACGPAIGGLRMAPDVSTDECFRLARAMTLKNAAAGLPHGGGKSVVFGDPRRSHAQKEPVIRAMACALADCRDYIFGPDMGTDEVCMAWVRDEIGRAVGLPREVGGIPLDEIGATGFGLACATEVAAEACDLDLRGARVAVQGFGSVGRHAARFLVERGAVLIAVADSRGAVHCATGLDLDALLALKRDGRSVGELSGVTAIDLEALVDVECDVWIPAARPDVIRVDNVSRLKTRMVVSGANIPITAEAEDYLHEHGVLCVPDFIANAGGVICGAMEYAGSSQQAAFAAIEEKVRENTRTVLERARADRVPPRRAATEMAVERVQHAMSYRRWSVF